MASDFTLARQYFQKEQCFFFITDQTPCPYPTKSLPTQFWHWCKEWSYVLLLPKPLTAKEILLCRDLKPGLPKDTPALYPLIHELLLFVDSISWVQFAAKEMVPATPGLCGSVYNQTSVTKNVLERRWKGSKKHPTLFVP
jgi:hypothetical protein